jgi:ribulose-phosphate 3-epimerase
VVHPPSSGGAPVTAVSRRVEIIPSVLPADFARLGDEVVALEKAGADRIQWDVMDGRFVPNLTFGPDVIAACRPHVALPFEAHLMVEEPDDLLPRYVEAGCRTLIVHAESTRHLHRTLGRVRDLGADAGVALNPATPPEAVAHVLDLCTMVLVMTVNPGFGGQDYIATMEAKISTVQRLIADRGLDCDVEVDGGIGPSTVQGAVAAGANLLVAGSSLYRDPGGLEHAVSELRGLAHSAQQTRGARP